MTSRQSILATLFSCATLTLSLHASAEPAVKFGPDGRPQTVIEVDDLDLSEPNDVQTLYTRVQQAAAAVCEFSVRNERRSRTRIPFGWEQRCFDDAVEEAVRSANRPELTALHRGTSQLIAERQ